MKIEPYLFFDGRAEEAIAFYEAHLGATREMLMRFSDSPDPFPDGMEPVADQVMHASLIIGESRLMISDGCEPRDAGFAGFSLTLTVKDVAEAERVFAVLADGGEIRIPQSKTFFAASFGMVTDKFGVTWGVIAEA